MNEKIDKLRETYRETSLTEFISLIRDTAEDFEGMLELLWEKMDKLEFRAKKLEELDKLMINAGWSPRRY